ncbi:MAG: O-antigen ligase family protein [Planctomycetia bacterium]|nr:O-antigen ligase family protein [Planctomycetia bacterium]
MEFMLAIGVLIALFWVGVVLLRGGLIGGCLAVLLTGSCFGHPFFKVQTWPLPLTLDRVLLVVLLVQYLIYRHLGLTDAKPLSKTDIVLGSFIILLLLSTFAHDWQVRQSRPLSQVVLFYLMPLALYWVARQATVSERAIARIVGSLAVFGVYLAVTAIAETHEIWWAVFPAYIGSDEHPMFLGRGRGPFLNPISCGFFQSIGLCATLLWWPRLNRPGKLLLLLFVPLFAWGIYGALTRSVWMGAVAGIMALIGLSMPRNLRVPVVAGMILVATVVTVTKWESILTYKRDKELSAELTAESAELRPIMATVAWLMFVDHPLVGCGYGQYPEVQGIYLSDRTTDQVLEKVRPYVQHNIFLSLLTETGLLGMGLFIALLALWFKNAWSLWRNEQLPLSVRQCGLLLIVTIAIYLPNGMFHDTSLASMINMIVFFLAGVTTGLATSASIAPEYDRQNAAQWTVRGAHRLATQ